MNKNIRSFLRFGSFLLILVLVVLLANALLIQTDTYSALPLTELKSRDDIDLAVVGSSIVGEHLNANLVSEQTGWSTRLSWLAASAPCLILAFMGLSSFVGFTRFASIIQVVTGLGIILAYNLSRKRVGSSALLGRFGALPFQILIACCSLLATVGAVLPVT